MPTSLSKLEQAVKRAHSAYDKAETAAREQQHAARQAGETQPDDSAGNDEIDADATDSA